MSTTVVDLLRSATALQALTLKGPWGELVAYKDKNRENRKWKPPAGSLGRLLAIHQGMEFDPAAHDWVRQNVDVRAVPSRHQVKRGVVLAVAVLARVEENSLSPWAMAGRFHWVLEGTLALSTPVPCKGAQGLWQVPEPVFHQVREQLLNREAQARAAVALSAADGPPTGLEKVAAEAWAATRNPKGYFGMSTPGQVAKCTRGCGGMEMYPGVGVHGSRMPVGRDKDWPRCGHGAWMFQDCVGKPCPPPCCQRAQVGGAP